MNAKITLILALILLSFWHESFSQLNLSGGAKINISGGAIASEIYVVIDTPSSTPISTSGTTDGIIMESEYNRLQYNLGTATTAITVPFMSTLLESIPLTVSPTNAGVGSGNILFSSKIAATRATGFNNSLFKPSDVLAMNPGESAIDRFWIIDATNYTTKPAVTLSFTYIDAEWASNGGNTITEASLKAQRYNNATNSWEVNTVFPATGTINTTNNTVSSVNVSASNFYRTWTLSDQVVPLPINLSFFQQTCQDNGDVLLTWSAIPEMNTDYFTVEKSIDGISWSEVSTLVHNGNKAVSDYSYILERTAQSNLYYFRLKQTDFNGEYEYSEIIFSSCDGSENIYYNQNNEIIFDVNSSVKENLSIQIYDVQGRVLIQSGFPASKGMNHFELNIDDLVTGTYNVVLISDKTMKNKKLIIAK